MRDNLPPLPKRGRSEIHSPPPLSGRAGDEAHSSSGKGQRRLVFAVLLPFVSALLLMLLLIAASTIYRIAGTSSVQSPNATSTPLATTGMRKDDHENESKGEDTRGGIDISDPAYGQQTEFEPPSEQQAESEPSTVLAGSADTNLDDLEGDIEDNLGATELDQRSEARDSAQANQDRFEDRDQVSEDEGKIVISESPTASEGGSKPKILNASVTGGRSLVGGEAAAGHLTLSAEFNSHIVALRNEGLEIALLFDATGSMGPQIYQAKQKLRNIISAIHSLVPNATFTVAVYRDYDTIPAQGIRLTSDPEAIDQFLKNVRLMAGGDEPESVASGLFWLVKHNVFSKSAKRVLIIVGDAPPHRHEFAKCLRLVDAFCDSKDARVYTVTCNKLRPLREFVAISNRGNGEALSLAANSSVVRELLVLSLGPEYRDEIDKMAITP
jgi:hypothetical protein